MKRAAWLMLLCLGCAKPTKIEPKQPAVAHDGLRVEFVATQGRVSLLDNCRHEFEGAMSIVETNSSKDCASQRNDNDLTVYHCDDSSELKVLEKNENKFRYFPINVTCQQMLAKLGYVYIQSSPPMAQVLIDGKSVGKAPRWEKLNLGGYTVECKTQQDIFYPVSVQAGQDVKVICQRQNQQAKTETQDELSGEEKAGGILMYIGGGLVSLAAIVLPFIFFF